MCASCVSPQLPTNQLQYTYVSFLLTPLLSKAVIIPISLYYYVLLHLFYMRKAEEVGYTRMYDVRSNNVLYFFMFPALLAVVKAACVRVVECWLIDFCQEMSEMWRIFVF